MAIRVARTSLAILLAALLLPLAIAQSASSFLPESSLFVGVEQRIPMRDGKSLAADIYTPKAEGAHAVVLIQTPYNKGLMRALFESTENTPRGPLFTDDGFAFVITDWRDRFASKDAATPGIEAGNGRDGYDTVEWIAQQPWCNGKVGTWGPSALGAAQYRTAREHPPHLVCAVPVVMPLNLRYEVYFQGGVLWEEFALNLRRLGWDLYDRLKANPIHSPYWTQLETAFIKPSEIEIPMLVIGGWYDIYSDSVVDTFLALKNDGNAKVRESHRLIMGPWIHRTDEIRNGALEYPDAAQFGYREAHAFLKYWLRGEGEDYAASSAPIRYYQMGASQWREADTWPPAGTAEKRLYLSGRDALGPEATAEATLHTIQSDPANPAPTIGGHVLAQELTPGPQDQREKVESRGDVLSFSTSPLEADVLVAGRPVVTAFVSTDGLDTDFSAILTDVYPDGRSMLVTEGIQRLRFREGVDREVLAKPGEVYEIQIELVDTAITFKAGHRIRLLISSSNHPKYAINLNDGREMYVEGPGRIAQNQLLAGGKYSSALRLPVLEQ